MRRAIRVRISTSAKSCSSCLYSFANLAWGVTCLAQTLHIQWRPRRVAVVASGKPKGRRTRRGNALGMCPRTFQASIVSKRSTLCERGHGVNHQRPQSKEQCTMHGTTRSHNWTALVCRVTSCRAVSLQPKCYGLMTVRFCGSIYVCVNVSMALNVYIDRAQHGRTFERRFAP